MNENGKMSDKTEKPWTRAPRFGREKPAIAGPGRPTLPASEKERRKYLRGKIQEATPKAIDVLVESLQAHQTKDRIRAAEVLVSHSLPKQEEVELDGHISPLAKLPEADITAILKDALANGSPAPASNGNGGNGSAA